MSDYPQKYQIKRVVKALQESGVQQAEIAVDPDGTIRTRVYIATAVERRNEFPPYGYDYEDEDENENETE